MAVPADPEAVSAAAALAASERAEAHSKALEAEFGEPDAAPDWPRSPVDHAELSKASSVSGIAGNCRASVVRVQIKSCRGGHEVLRLPSACFTGDFLGC